MHTFGLPSAYVSLRQGSRYVAFVRFKTAAGLTGLIGRWPRPPRSLQCHRSGRWSAASVAVLSRSSAPRPPSGRPPALSRRCATLPAARRPLRTNGTAASTHLDCTSCILEGSIIMSAAEVRRPPRSDLTGSPAAHALGLCTAGGCGWRPTASRHGHVRCLSLSPSLSVVCCSSDPGGTAMRQRQTASGQGRCGWPWRAAGPAQRPHGPRRSCALPSLVT
jgi:hypothetical protein